MDDHHRFLGLFLRNEADLRAFIGSVVRDWTAVDDILQETAAVLWRKFSLYDQTRSFGAWARGVAALEIRKHHDRSVRRLPLLDPAAIAALETVWEQESPPAAPRLAALQRCLEGVDDASRKLLALRYADGLELDEVAQRSGRGSEAVGKALQRLRSALAECVGRRLSAEAGR